MKLCDVCCLAKARKLPLVSKARLMHQPIMRNPTDLSDKVGKVVHVDLEFYGVEAPHTRNTVNFFLVDEFTDEHYCGGSKDKSGDSLCKILKNVTNNLNMVLSLCCCTC